MNTPRGDATRRRRLVRSRCEALEDRTLLAVDLRIVTYDLAVPGINAGTLNGRRFRSVKTRR